MRALLSFCKGALNFLNSGPHGPSFLPAEKASLPGKGSPVARKGYPGGHRKRPGSRVHPRHLAGGGAGTYSEPQNPITRPFGNAFVGRFSRATCGARNGAELNPRFMPASVHDGLTRRNKEMQPYSRPHACSPRRIRAGRLAIFSRHLKFKHNRASAGGRTSISGESLKGELRGLGRGGSAPPESKAGEHHAANHSFGGGGSGFALA